MITDELRQQVCDLLNKDTSEYIGRILNNEQVPVTLVNECRQKLSNLLQVPVENVVWSQEHEEYRVQDGDITLRFTLTARRV